MINFGRQMTVAMPLEAVYHLLADVKGNVPNRSPILSDVKRDAIHIVRRADFAEACLDKINPSDDLLGSPTPKLREECRPKMDPNIH